MASFICQNCGKESSDGEVLPALIRWALCLVFFYPPSKTKVCSDCAIQLWLFGSICLAVMAAGLIFGLIY